MSDGRRSVGIRQAVVFGLLILAATTGCFPLRRLRQPPPPLDDPAGSVGTGRRPSANLFNSDDDSLLFAFGPILRYARDSSRDSIYLDPVAADLVSKARRWALTPDTGLKSYA